MKPEKIHCIRIALVYALQALYLEVPEIYTRALWLRDQAFLKTGQKIPGNCVLVMDRFASLFNELHIPAQKYNTLKSLIFLGEED